MIISRPASHTVVVVASFGGLEALEQLMPLLQPTGQHAYVLVQHMGSGAHTDLTARLLSRFSRLSVAVLSPGVNHVLRPDVLYLVPAAHDAIWQRGVLELQAASSGATYVPSANRLLHGLAREQPLETTAVVLSGAGRDGVDGCRALRRGGGQVLVMAPSAAKAAGMPLAVIESGIASKVGSIVQIAEWLLSPCLARVSARAVARAPWPVDMAYLQQVLRLAQVKLGLDLSLHRTDTLLRRLRAWTPPVELMDPAVCLAQAEQDVELLHDMVQQLMVSYSYLNRDPVTWEILAQTWQQDLQLMQSLQPVRIWVPACAGGEEVFTLAMLLVRLLGLASARQRVQLLGTDLNPDAIVRALSGDCAGPRESSSWPDWMRPFLTTQGERWQVAPDIRRMCEFQLGNALEDSPPGPVDVISCRNLLIYLNPEGQKKMISSILRSLRPRGWLLLSGAERLPSSATGSFQAVNTAHSLFRRRAMA